MFNIRKIGLTTLALGLMASPVFAGNMEDETSLKSQINVEGEAAVTETTPANFDFEVYDRDDDGYVTQEEFEMTKDATTSIDLFTTYDADTDGTLTEEEFETLARDENVVETEIETTTEMN